MAARRCKSFFQTERAGRIYIRLAEMQARGRRTSRGERISLAAIGRTLDPPVHRITVYQVARDLVVSARVRAAIERELKKRFWPRGR